METTIRLYKPTTEADNAATTQDIPDCLVAELNTKVDLLFGNPPEQHHSTTAVPHIGQVRITPDTSGGLSITPDDPRTILTKTSSSVRKSTTEIHYYDHDRATEGHSRSWFAWEREEESKLRVVQAANMLVTQQHEVLSLHDGTGEDGFAPSMGAVLWHNTATIKVAGHPYFVNTPTVVDLHMPGQQLDFQYDRDGAEETVYFGIDPEAVDETTVHQPNLMAGNLTQTPETWNCDLVLFGPDQSGTVPAPRQYPGAVRIEALSPTEFTAVPFEVGDGTAPELVEALRRTVPSPLHLPLGPHRRFQLSTQAETGHPTVTIHDGDDRLIARANLGPRVDLTITDPVAQHTIAATIQESEIRFNATQGQQTIATGQIHYDDEYF